MGKTYQFECEKCGYRAAVAGGLTEGLDLKVITLVCGDCRALCDCVVAVRTTAIQRLGTDFNRVPQEVAPSLQAALTRLPQWSRAPSSWQRFEPVCPTNKTHRVKPWTSPGRCPRCKTYLEPGALPYRVWD
jgi:hypothetical protein